ncbi:hypothetical protein D9756_001491 [Leucocoprinus leucothites]|uniref:Uncharacterized protein n=1 Tax=Leucocoprinus leucothites TaxID=201217 RepID=A0A8H5LI38_9AGAR|nr:hypothetical protein D9756_001491 [Leucoagaricus leucothites]
MPGSALFSGLLGYVSIGCWLGAQFPQVLENFRRQSCDGLAWPFLANWFLGDFSNLIGCLLTNQLPFQVYLATYFCLIDLVLLSQYLYYERPSKSLASPPPPTASYPQRPASVIPTSRKLSTDRTTTRYRTLSAVAANVAAAAALAARQDERSARHTTGHDSDLLLRADGPHSFTSHIPLGDEAHDSDSDDGHPAAMIDSFYSEGGRDIGRKRVSWSIERHRTRAGSVNRISAIGPSLVSPITALDVDSVRRGRSLGRSTEELLEDSEEATQASEPVSSAANRRNSRAGKKSATMVFLGAWALFGVGTFVGSKRGLSSKTATLNVGRVLSPLSSVRSSMGQDVPIAVTSTMAAIDPSLIPDAVREIPLTFKDQGPSTPTEPVPPPHDSHPSIERIIGRISAWLCTTLYLTSRLPQIWKNGLSMYLFVFAFLGNVFYVASILLSPNAYLPPPQSTEFMKESIPYLLGSGGTLMFDITIVTQSFIYKPKHKRRYTRSRSNTANIEVGSDSSEDVTVTTESERSGLLAGDALAKYHHHTYSQQPGSLYSTAAATTSNSREDGLTRGRTTQVARSISD